MTLTVMEGDCLTVMPALDADSFDAIVTDPPYGLNFMGKAWDSFGRQVEFRERGGDADSGVLPGHGRGGNSADVSAFRARASLGFQAFSYLWAIEAIRVARPGAHLIAFGGTRTHHRLMCAIEDAGWEIRDCLMYMYGSGFPKSLDVSKAIDKAAGAERTKVAATGGLHANRNLNDDGWSKIGIAAPTMDGPVPVTDLAARWDGWGTALKPAWEPIILARKPLVGTVAANVTAHGTGVLNIDGCRIGDEVRVATPTDLGPAHGNRLGAPETAGMRRQLEPRTYTGRWPANVVLDEGAAALLDAATGDLSAGNHPANRRGIGYTEQSGGENAGTAAGRRSTDTGGASRFFYTAKASRSEREAGCEGLERVGGGAEQFDSRWKEGTGEMRKPVVRNHHPTVKPLDLMRWLCRLVTPPGGLVLDPFCGSGTTGCAASTEGFRFIGIELDPASVAIARARTVHVQPGLPL